MSLKDMPYIEAETITQHKFSVVVEDDLEDTLNQLSSEDWEMEEPERVGDPQDDDPALRANVKYILRGKRECCVCANCRVAAGRPLRGSQDAGRKRGRTRS